MAQRPVWPAGYGHYSDELKDRVINSIRHGMTQKQAADFYDIPVRTVGTWLKKAETP